MTLDPNRQKIKWSLKKSIRKALVDLNSIKSKLQTKLFTYTERLVAQEIHSRKTRFLKVISLFSFLGIMLGVAVLIIVMSVMNGFRTDLTNKIIGLNPHLILQFQNNKRLQDLKTVLKDKYPGVKISETVSGEGIIIINNKVKEC